jgi:hypothetical protein
VDSAARSFPVCVTCSVPLVEALSNTVRRRVAPQSVLEIETFVTVDV